VTEKDKNFQTQNGRKKDNDIEEVCSNVISFTAYAEITRIVGAAQTSLLENVPSQRAQCETRRAHQNM
jgi:5-methylthioribose kinase